MPLQQEAISPIFPRGWGELSSLWKCKYAVRWPGAAISCAWKPLASDLSPEGEAAQSHLGRCCAAPGGKPFCILSLCREHQTPARLYPRACTYANARKCFSSEPDPTGICPFWMQMAFGGGGTDPPHSYLGQILLLCWRWIAWAGKRVAGVNTCGRVPACISLWSQSQTAFVIHLHWKKHFIFLLKSTWNFLQVLFLFLLSHEGDLQRGWRRICKKCAHFQLSFFKISKLLARSPSCNSEIRVVF